MDADTPAIPSFAVSMASSTDEVRPRFSICSLVTRQDEYAGDGGSHLLPMGFPRLTVNNLVYRQQRIESLRRLQRV